MILYSFYNLNIKIISIRKYHIYPKFSLLKFNLLLSLVPYASCKGYNKMTSNYLRISAALHELVPFVELISMPIRLVKTQNYEDHSPKEMKIANNVYRAGRAI